MSNGKANVFIMCPDTQENINAILIRQQYAERIEEDYISNYNHLMRESQLESQMIQGNYDNFLDPMSKEYSTEEYYDEVEAPPFAKCKTKIKLKGPYSSLSIEPHGLTESTRNSSVIIDKHSVNSVILENNPQVSEVENFKISENVFHF